MVQTFEQFLNDLRASLSLYDVISRRVSLKRKGREYWGCCPFHNEKTPSFAVNEEKGFYHCFGCGAHGDIIKFEMETNKLPFIEAVRNLADLAGLELPAQTDEQKQRMNFSKKIKEIQEVACQFFEKELKEKNGHDALLYLKQKRHLTDETIKTFRIGFIGKDSKKLLQFLKDKGITEQELLQSGLFRKSQRNKDELYSYFRDRIVFPIMDRRGDVIAFSGRIMGQGEPKYLNSTESEVFKKGSVVFGYSQAREESLAKNQVLAVEGQLDMIRLYQEGIKNVVAPLGTALTEIQVNIMWQIADEITLCFDGDLAGQKAAIRGVHRAVPVLKPGKTLNVSMMPQGKDPDDILNEENGKQKIIEFTEKKHSIFEVLWNEAVSNKNINSPEHQAKIETDLTHLYKEIKDFSIQKYYLQQLRNRLWDTFKKTGQISEKKEEKPIFKIKPLKMIVAYLVTYPSLQNQMIEQIIGLIHGTTEFNSLIEKMKRQTELMPPDYQIIATEVQMLKSRGEESMKRAQDELNDLINRLNLSQLEEDIAFIRKKFTETADPELWEKIKNMQGEYQRLKQGIDEK